MQYTAKNDTLLKKRPEQGSTLADNEKVAVPAGKAYPVKEVLETDGLHSHIELDHQAGKWWIFLPHWDTTAESGEVKAEFSFKQARTNSLIEGWLVFTRNGQEILKVKATSGLPGHQYAGAHTTRGKGCIPPADDWKISTSGYYLATKGVEGMFYHITPDPRSGRGELGLHRDANVPGSSGCVVVRNSTEFNSKVVPMLNGLKQSHVTLSVVYS